MQLKEIVLYNLVQTLLITKHYRTRKIASKRSDTVVRTLACVS